MRTIAIIYLGFWLLHNFAVAQNPPADLTLNLQQVAQSALPNNLNHPGLVLGVHVPGQWSWQTAAGNSITGFTANQPAKSASPTDKFRIGSITKMFVASAILKLEEEGKLSVNDNIDLYLRSSLINDTIKSSASVKILNLLEHTSGIPDLANNDSCKMNAMLDLTRKFSHEEAIYCGCIQGEEFPPGFTWGYSNTNYSLLAMIIENVSGVNFKVYIEDKIIIPLGLMNTFFPASDEISDPHMGCYWNLPPMTDLTIVDASLYNGWADMVSDTKDLYTFYHALRSGTLISQASLNRMFSISSISFDYGLGVEFFDLDGDSFYGHSGDVGNTSGLFFVDISTSAFPNGYYISYNYNYEGVDMINLLELPIHDLMKNYVPQSITKIEERAKDELIIFPNPSLSSFSVMVDRDDEYELRIYDMMGRELLMFDVRALGNEIKVVEHGLSSGMYQLILTNSQRQRGGKINIL